MSRIGLKIDDLNALYDKVDSLPIGGKKTAINSIIQHILDLAFTAEIEQIRKRNISKYIDRIDQLFYRVGAILNQ